MKKNNDLLLITLNFVFSREHYADIRRLFPLSEIQHVAGAGHWVHADRPHEFIAAVTQFIAEGSR